MQTRSGLARHSNRATTLVEVLVIVGIVVMLAGIVIPSLAVAKGRTQRIQCINHLKNLGFSSRISAADLGSPFPHSRSNQPGGTLDWSANPAQVWKHFARLSNEMSSPLILQCPADRERPPVPTWTQFTNNAGLGYFLGRPAAEDRPDTVLFGDRNVMVGGAPMETRQVMIDRQTALAFDYRLHRFAGNLAMGDGSVQQVNSAQLQALASAASARTNVLVWIFP